jgi:2-aminoethylphosphonate-pyruvate transaminase
MTDRRVREAMNVDFAPWDRAFLSLYSGVVEKVADIAGASDDQFAALPLQGCGHFAIEAAFAPLSHQARRC